MKIRNLCVAIVLFAVATSASAQETKRYSGFLEGQSVITPDGTDTYFNSFTSITIKGKVGAYVWAQTSKEYSQAYGGLTYSPRSWMQFGAGAGAEQADSPWRVGGFLWMGKGRFYNLLILEKGGGGYWYKNEAGVRIHARVTVGGIVQRFLGAGPRVEVRLSKKFSIWGAPAYDFEAGKTKGTVALRYSF